MSTRTLRETCEGEALALFLVSDAISLAEEKGDHQLMDAAIEQNLNIWLTVKAHCLTGDTVFPQHIRNNLMTLADYVSRETAMIMQGHKGNRSRSLASINLQIAEGLLESVRNNEISDKTAQKTENVASQDSLEDSRVH